MSKIYEAYKKQLGPDASISLQVGRVGVAPLFPEPDSGQQDEFNQLANRLLSLKSDIKGAIYAFASTSRGEGSSFVSYNTAVCLASVYRQRVAWVDANFISPQAQLKSQDGVSLSMLLEDPAAFDSLGRSGKLTVVPAGLSLERNRGLFAGHNCQQVFQRLRQEFDFTIIDLPPVLSTSDTALVATAVDGMMLVIRQRYLKREVIEHGVDKLRAKSVHVLGAVINRRTYDLPKVIYDRL